MVEGKRCCGDDVADKEEARQYKEIIKQVTKYAGVPNPGEIWPILNWLGYEKMMMKLGERTDVFLQGLIDEHRMKKSSRNSPTICFLCRNSSPSITRTKLSRVLYWLVQNSKLYICGIEYCLKFQMRIKCFFF